MYEGDAVWPVCSGIPMDELEVDWTIFDVFNKSGESSLIGDEASAMAEEDIAREDE